MHNSPIQKYKHIKILALIKFSYVRMGSSPLSHNDTLLLFSECTISLISDTSTDSPDIAKTIIPFILNIWASIKNLGIEHITAKTNTTAYISSTRCLLSSSQSLFPR